jgi:peptidyl-prolyl cis-trans isomerase D
MLNVMRKHAGSWMIKVILFAIVIVFVFWGVGSFRSREASKVAVVNGEIINLSDYRRVYNNMIDQYRQRFGSSLNDGMIEMLQLKKQALDQLITRAILLQESEKLDLRVSDSEIARSIMDTPAFQSNGSFDERRYRSILSRFHLTPEEYETDQKEVLLGEKLTRIIMGAAKVSEPEARQWYDWQNTSVNIAYVVFKPNNYSGITPSEEEIAAYFEDNKEDYKTDPMVKVRYVVFDPDDYKGQVSVADDEVRDYYDNHIDDFRSEKTVEARHILIKVDPDADDKADAAAKNKAEEIAKMAKSGQDFAELAKTHSEGPTRNQGGYLGKFGRSQMVKPFADKAFSMTAGEISDPVKTRFGWHVIKVESVQDATTKTLEQSKPSIVSILTDRKAKSLAYDKAEQFYEGTYEKDDLVKNAKTFGLPVLESGPFNRSGPDDLGPGKTPFANAAFGLGVDEISDIQDIGGRYYLIQVTEAIDAAIPKMEDVKAKVEEDLTKKIQSDRAAQDAKDMAAELTADKTLEESAANRKLTVKKTGLFTRDKAIPEIGNDPKITKAAFLLPSIGSTSKEPVQGNAGFYLLRLEERKAPAGEDFEKEQDKIKDRLLRQKQRTVLQDWVDERRAESEITIEDAYLE